MNDEIEIREEIPQGEIDELRAEHAAICKTVRRVFWRALAIGETLLEWHRRMGVRERDPGSFWGKWIAKNLPDISQANIRRYVSLARNRQFLETKFSALTMSAEELKGEELEKLPTIREALRAIAEKNEENQSKKLAKKVIDIKAEPSNGSASKGDLWSDRPIKTVMPIEVSASHEEWAASLAAATAKTPTEILKEWIGRYVLDATNCERDLAEILERIRLIEISGDELRHLISLECLRVPEMEAQVVQAIFGWR